MDPTSWYLNPPAYDISDRWTLFHVSLAMCSSDRNVLRPCARGQHLVHGPIHLVHDTRDIERSYLMGTWPVLTMTRAMKSRRRNYKIWHNAWLPPASGGTLFQYPRPSYARGHYSSDHNLSLQMSTWVGNKVRYLHKLKSVPVSA